MLSAYDAVTKKEMGYLKASKTFNVPRTTLHNYVTNSTKTVAELYETKLGRKTTFSPELEKQLVEYCNLMVNRGYGLLASDVRTLAFQLATKNKIPNQFMQGSAGRRWLTLFLTRNPSISFMAPKPTSVRRAKGFTRAKINYFYDILEKELPQIDMDPTRVFNVDVTGITILKHKLSKVLSMKGQKKVDGLSSAEREVLVSLVTCMSAVGMYVPPMFVFPRENMKAELIDGAPPGSIFTCHKSGWIQQHLFTQWLSHFIYMVKPSEQKPVILILDGHYSHTRNLDVIDMARESGIIVLSLPPHSTYRIQPLDVAFMGPFKTFYANEVETWLMNHPGRVVTSYQVSELMGKAYIRAATKEVAIDGFKKSGIYPFNRDLFRDHDFALSTQMPTPVQSCMPSREFH